MSVDDEHSGTVGISAGLFATSAALLHGGIIAGISLGFPAYRAWYKTLGLVLPEVTEVALDHQSTLQYTCALLAVAALSLTFSARDATLRYAVPIAVIVIGSLLVMGLGFVLLIPKLFGTYHGLSS